MKLPPITQRRPRPTQSLPSRGAWIETNFPCGVAVSNDSLSRSPHGGRGLKHGLADVVGGQPGRSPHGGRGLKHLCPRDLLVKISCRSPHGGRGLKQFERYPRPAQHRRSPHGGRGLKHPLCRGIVTPPRRSPHGGRGLKRLYSPLYPGFHGVAPLTGGVD